MRKERLKKLFKRLIIILLMLCVAFGGYVIWKGKTPKNEGNKIDAKEIKYGSINVQISGDGVIEPFERYDITPLVYGNIEECDFNETDLVKKDDVLYKFESFTVENSIKKLENNLEKLLINQDKLKKDLQKINVIAPHSGRLSGFNVKKDENVSSMAVAHIIDDSYYTVEVFFNKAQIEKMYVGEEAIVVIPDVMASDKGNITKISDTFIPQSNGVSLYSVEITINKKLSITEGTGAYAIVDGIQSVGNGRIKDFERYPIIPEIAGKVKAVYFCNNDYVKEGQTLFVLDDENYLRAIRDARIDIENARLSLNATKKDLEDYSVKSPIDGVVLSKEYKAGDSINSNYKGTALMVVANMSKVKFDMEIDELDIAKVKKGQEVEVTADALVDETFLGKVTSVAEEGTSVNGVTNYTVEVTIDEPGSLKSGMNVDAIIIIENKDNVLLVPSLAVNKEGNKYYVNVCSQDSDKIEKRYIETGVSDSQNVEVLSGLKAGEQVLANSTSGLENLLNMNNLRKNGDEQRQNMLDNMSGGGGMG